MKTIVRTETNLSLYCLADDVAINLGDNVTVVGEPAQFIINDCNAHNVQVFEQVTAPDDWEGGKYCFDGQAWSIAPDWIEPASDGSANL